MGPSGGISGTHDPVIEAVGAFRTEPWEQVLSELSLSGPALPPISLPSLVAMGLMGVWGAGSIGEESRAWGSPLPGS